MDDRKFNNGVQRGHALYPGTFDVLTFGHLDIVRRAATIFRQLTVAVAQNIEKQHPLFSSEERMEMLREAVVDLPNVVVTSFKGLTVEFAREVGAQVIVRGLRAVSDFEFELQMAMMNESLNPDICTVFMAPAPAYSFLSSSLVKEIARFGGDVSAYVPEYVARRLEQRVKENGWR
ncbi:MAG: pantetheine-phosphate adenylyltransferase [Candidatus Sumerlaeaceae bacterium]